MSPPGSSTSTIPGSCPWCGETVELIVDPSGGRRQEYVEDCFVCCHPCVILVEIDGDDEARVRIERE